MKLDIKKMTDLHKLGISYLAAVLVFQIVFFRGDPLANFMAVSSLFWLLVLPGLMITYIWRMGFAERFALSVAISSAVVGIGSYYLGLAGVDVKISSVVIPAVFIIIGLVVVFRNKISLK